MSRAAIIPNVPPPAFSLSPDRLPGRSRGGSRWSWRLRMALSLGALLGTFVISSLGYYILEDQYSVLDSVYMTAITIATVGYKEVHDLSLVGRLWTLFVIAAGLVSGAVFLSLFVAMIVEGQIRQLFGRRQLERKIANLKGHVIVCGYGRMGSLVADELAAAREVVVVDANTERTALAEQRDLLYVVGDAQEDQTLKTAGIERAEVLVCSLSGDADNVFLTLTAREANPKLQIIARAQESATQDKLLKAGASRVVCPQIIGASRIADVVLRPAVVDFVEIAHRGVELEMDRLEVHADSELVGKTLRELGLPQRVGAHVVAVRRADGEAIYTPMSDLRVEAGDTLLLIGKRGSAAEIERIQTAAETEG